MKLIKSFVPHSRCFGSYFDVIFLMYLVSSGFSFKPTSSCSSSSSSTQFSQEWARRKVVVKHSIKSNQIKYKLFIDLKWKEMRSNVIFGYPILFWIKFPYIWYVAHWSEMAINTIEKKNWSSKMAASSHFVKKISVAYWSEIARNAIKSDFLSSKMAAWGHFVKIKKKVPHLSEMLRNAISVIRLVPKYS